MKTYSTPELAVYGNATELTQATNVGGFYDSVYVTHEPIVPDQS